MTVANDTVNLLIASATFLIGIGGSIWAMSYKFSKVESRVEKLEEDWEHNRTQLSGLSDAITGLDRRIQSVEIKTSTTEVKIDGIKEDISSIKGDMKDLKKIIEEMLKSN